MTEQTREQATEHYRERTSAGRLMVFALLFIALTAAGLYAVYDQFAGRSLTFDWKLLAPQNLLAILTLLAVYFAADGLRLHYTLRALGYRLPFPVIFRLVFINLFFSNVTPMATGGGFAQVWYLQQHGVSIGRATAATTIRTVLAIAFIFSLTPVFLLTLDVLQGQRLLARIGGVLTVLIVAYLGFFAVVLFRTHWLIGPLARTLDLLHRWHLIGERRHRRWHFKARREMLRFARSFGEYLHGPRHCVVLSVCFTFLFLLSLFSFPALLMVSLDYDVDYLVSVGLMVVTTFIMYFSPTQGASGISEGVFGSFFSGILTPGHLLLVTISWRVLTIYTGMLIGLILMQRGLMQKELTPKSMDTR